MKTQKPFKNTDTEYARQKIGVNRCESVQKTRGACSQIWSENHQ